MAIPFTPAQAVVAVLPPDAGSLQRSALDPTTLARFDVQGSWRGGTLGSLVQVAISINPVADTPKSPMRQWMRTKFEL